MLPKTIEELTMHSLASRESAHIFRFLDDIVTSETSTENLEAIVERWLFENVDWLPIHIANENKIIIANTYEFFMTSHMVRSLSRKIGA